MIERGMLSIVVCARNEADNVSGTLTGLRQVFPEAELILVDNGSTDGTAERASAVPGVVILREDTPGKGVAMRAGAESASGKWLLFHDADTEYDIADSLQVVTRAIQEDGCCVGARMVSYDRVLVSSWLANWLIKGLLRIRTGKSAPDVLSGTRCMKTKTFLELQTQSTRFGIETEITRGLLVKGIPMFWTPVRFYPRTAKQGKKIRVWHLAELLLQAMR